MEHRFVPCLIALAIAALLLSIAAPVLGEEAAVIERRLAKDPTNITLIVDAGRAYLNDAQHGDTAALGKAEEYLDRALVMSPDDPHILALHGSMLALKGRDAVLPLVKMQHVQNGLEEMDRAVELAPMEYGIRYRRGLYCLHLPEIFERTRTAVEDFEYLLVMVKQAPNTISSEEATALRLNLAQARLKVGNVEGARTLLISITTDSPGTAYADKASALLARIDG